MSFQPTIPERGGEMRSWLDLGRTLYGLALFLILGMGMRLWWKPARRNNTKMKAMNLSVSRSNLANYVMAEPY